jgi:hypothetical protein
MKMSVNFMALVGAGRGEGERLGAAAAGSALLKALILTALPAARKGELVGWAGAAPAASAG